VAWIGPGFDTSGERRFDCFVDFILLVEFFSLGVNYFRVEDDTIFSGGIVM